MSAIQDALKRAQRERQKRTAAAAGISSSAPILVPVRSSRGTGFPWVWSLAIGIVVALLVGGAAVVVEVLRTSARPPLPALPAPVADDQIVTPMSNVRSARPPNPSLADSATGSRRVADISHATVAATREPSERERSDAVPSFAPDSARAQLQAQLRDPGARDFRPSDRLHITVDRPNAEAARLFSEAVIAHHNNDLGQARTLYEQALAITPGDPDLLNNYGVLLSSQHELDRAIEFLRRAIGLAPANAGIWTNLGFAYRERGRPSDAVAAFQRALALDPRRPAAQISLAQQYIAMGSIDQARELVDRIIAMDSTSAEAYYTRGQILEMRGDREAAVRAYLSFLRLAPPRLAVYSDRVRRHLDTLGVQAQTP